MQSSELLEPDTELELDSEELGCSFDERSQSGMKGTITIPSSSKGQLVSRKNKDKSLLKQSRIKGVGHSNLATSKGSDDLCIPITVGGITSENFFKQTLENSPL